MNYKNWLQIVAAPFLLNFGCSSEGIKTSIPVSSDFETVQIDTNTSSLKLSAVAKSIDYVPLETLEECAIGRIDKLLVDSTRIYLLDKKISKALFVFDKGGKFLYKKAVRQDELIRTNEITDFAIDPINQNLYLLTRDEKILMIFQISTGKYKKSIKVKGYFSEIAVFNANRIILAREGHDFKDAYGEYRVASFDSSGNILNKWFERPVNPTQNIGQVMMGQAIRNNELLIARPFNDTIFKITDSSLTAAFRFDFRKTYPVAIFTANSQEETKTIMLDPTISYFSGPIYSTDSSLSMLLKWKENFCLMNYNKSSGKATLTKYIENDIDRMVMPFMSFMNNNYFISVLPARLIQQYYSFNSTQPDFKSTNKKLIELINRISQDSNPILAFVSLK